VATRHVSVTEKVAVPRAGRIGRHYAFRLVE